MQCIKAAMEPVERTPKGKKLEQFEPQNKVAWDYKPTYKVKIHEYVLI